MADGTLSIKVLVDGKEVDILAKNLNGLEGSADKAGKSLGIFNGSAVKMAAGMLAGKAAIKALTAVKGSMDAAFRRIDTLENFERTLLRLYDGNEKVVKSVLDGTREVVTGTSYALDSAANKVQGFIVSGGRQWEQAVDDVGTWGDAIAFYGQGSSAQFDSILKDLVSMSSKGKVQMGDLTNVVAAGIPVYDIYAKAVGRSVSDVQADMTAGRISAEDFLDVMNTSFNDGIEGFVSVAGAAKDAGASWQGTFSNLGTAIARGTASIITNIDDAFGKTRVGSIRENIARFGSTFEDVLGKVATLTGTTIIVFDKFIAILSPISPLIIGIASAAATYSIISKYASVVKGAGESIYLTYLYGLDYIKMLKNGEIATKATTYAEKVATAGKLTWIAAQQAANFVLTTSNTLWKLANGQITAATAKEVIATSAKTLLTGAQIALNAAMAANPALLLAAGIGALVAIGAGLIKWFNRGTEAGKEFKKENEQLANSIENLNGTIESNEQAHKDNVTSIEASNKANFDLIGRVRALSEEENKTAAQKRQLSLLVGQLNEEMDGLNLAYDEEADLLNMTHAEMLKKNDAYAEQEKSVAIQERLVEALKEESEIDLKLDEITTQRAELANALKDGEIKHKEYKDRVKELDEQEQILTETQQTLADEVQTLETQWDESLSKMAQETEDSTERQKKAYDELSESQQAAMDEMKSTISDYTDHASNRMSTLNDDIEVTGREMIDNMKENQRVMAEWADNIAILAKRGIDEGLLEELRQAGPESAGEVAALVKMSDDELKEMNKVYGNSAKIATDTMKTSMGEGYDEVIDMAADFVQDTKTTLAKEIKAANFEGIGNDVMDGLADGMDEGAKGATKSAKKAADDVTKETKSSFDSHSPSRVFKGIGNDLMDGLSLGIDGSSSKATDSINKVGKQVTESFKSISKIIETDTKTWGGIIKSSLDVVQKNMKTGLDKSNNQVKTGVNDMNKNMKALTPNFKSIGSDAMNGLNQGLLNGKARVLNTAQSIANQVAQTMKKALDIHSPSRVMRDEVGRFIPEGIAVGIEENSKTALDSISDLTYDMIKIPKISAESLLDSGAKGASGSTTTNTSNVTNDNRTDYRGFFEGATIIWQGKEDIRQTMQDFYFMTQREELRLE